MGLFSSLFGSATSDAAQKARQDALNAFNSIQTPELAALQVQLQKYVVAGQLTPEEAETQLLSSNAFNNIVTDPSYVGAQKQALQQLQAVATQGGLTAIDKAQLQDITNQQNQQNQSQNAATMQQAQQRGVGGSNLNTVNQLINEQGNADRAAQAGTTVAANAQQRALQAMQAAGQAGSNLETQQYGEQANKANAQNAIDLFNKQALNQTNLYNTQTANAAQGANVANAQAVANANTQTANANQEYNAQQNQTVYQDALQKAQGIAGVDQNAATADQANATAERNASAGLIGGALQAGAGALGSAMGGPAVGAAASTAAGSQGFNPKIDSTNPYDDTEPAFAHGGEVTDPEHPDHMANGGHVHCYSHGGEAYHHPECMAKGGFLSGLKKGTLHKDLGVPQGEKIPSKKIEKATHSDNETLRKRAQFAENAKHWNHKADGGEIEGSTEPVRAEIVVEKKPAAPEDENFIQKLASLLGSHADAANKVDAESDGGRIDYRDGGSVPGRAKVKGDSPKNDTVDAKLSPGEIVVPRSAANDEDEFKKFMAKFEPNKKMAKGGMVPGIPRVNDTNPMRDTVRAPMNSVPLAATNDANDFTHMMNTFKPKKMPHKFAAGGPVPPMAPPTVMPAANPAVQATPPVTPPVMPPMAPAKPKKLPKSPVHITPEARALANLHHRVSNLEQGGK